jgi:hypothetical protein
LLDAKSWPEWREIFTEDLEWVYVDPTVQNVPPDAERLPDGRARVDREQLVAFVSKSMQKVTTVHHGHIPEIAIVDENVARGHWALTNYVEYRNAAGFLVWGRGYGWYDEEYFRTDSGWRIKRSAFYRRDMDLPQ